MAKEKNLNNWLKHDSNAKDDFKCMLIIEQLGLEGYGIFWVLVETLRDQKDYRYPIRLISALARKYNTTEAKMQTVVKDYGLFELDKDSFFFSQSLNRRMKAFDEVVEKRRLAGKKSGESRKKKTLEHNPNTCSTNVQLLDKKSEEEKKEELIKLKQLVSTKTPNALNDLFDSGDFIYLLSKYSLRQRLVTILTALITLGFIAFIFLPILFIFINYTTELIFHFIKGYYIETYTSLFDNIQIAVELKIPAPEKLHDFLSLFKSSLDFEQLSLLKINFQHNMFLLVTIVTFLEIGLPALINIVLHYHKIQIYISLLKATLLTTLLTIFIQFFITEVYYMDTTKIIGFSTIYLFMISYFLMQESSTLLHKDQKDK